MITFLEYLIGFLIGVSIAILIVRLERYLDNKFLNKHF
jgi:capsular polysaccharide biosynthesis protein